MSQLPQLPQRLHHYAFVIRDHEANRQFFEDVLGLPLVATWCERVFNTEVQREVAYCHTFFGLADGSALAFFQFADAEMYARSKAVYPQIGRFQHIAPIDPVIQRIEPVLRLLLGLFGRVSVSVARVSPASRLRFALLP